MISEEQMQRAEREFAANTGAAISVARDAERELERYTYYQRPFDPAKRDQLLQDYKDADYMAESRAWILNLIREYRAKSAAKVSPTEKTAKP